jgi:hypothetical protein
MVFLGSIVFRRADNSENNGVMRAFSCEKNCEKIFEMESLFKLFELHEVASA